MSEIVEPVEDSKTYTKWVALVFDSMSPKDRHDFEHVTPLIQAAKRSKKSLSIYQMKVILLWSSRLIVVPATSKYFRLRVIFPSLDWNLGDEFGGCPRGSQAGGGWTTQWRRVYGTVRLERGRSREVKESDPRWNSEQKFWILRMVYHKRSQRVS